jgi:hypothetical protein
MSLSVFGISLRHSGGPEERACARASDRGTRRAGSAARPMPALRPVVSSPPPSEPDMRLPPHPALHEHDERSLACAAGVGHGVPAAIRQRCAGIYRRPIVPRAHGTPSPCGRSPVLPGGALLPRLLRVLRHAPAATADGAPARSHQLGSGGHRRGASHLHSYAGRQGSAPNCTPGTSPRATATRRAASPARPVTGRARRPPASTRTEHPDSP